MTAFVEVKQEVFDPSVCLSQFTGRIGDEGAVVSFTGRARGQTKDGLPINALVLESYRGVTLASMQQIAADAHAKFAITASHVIHRAGRIKPLEAIVFVATASPHRRAAFEAADYLMDRLKTEAVFWKREEHANGSAWIEPTDADRSDVARW
ncbi:hypothetical protein EH31_10985 [Erythrobacter longus]|uniref:Molybdopterin synthase catalytic subunit n=2 Tax=Erythrobacteraceae TaxID=335929 RepID=A0A074M8F2_ERYLO|nr:MULTISPECIES: molybdenum cofactor biosynthesis protein MoaE [Erythrobacteraceae]KEO89674.1 hypothetical protein EH31_10985 [Erythrobacter longus]MXO91010.1 molybdenum cofactor biosynthesis protein MoaE [Pontixanthobacter aquaemixtae]